MTLVSVSPPIDTGHSYAFWAGTLAVALDTVLQANDELTRLRARRLLEEFEAECARRERRIAELAPRPL